MNDDGLLNKWSEGGKEGGEGRCGLFPPLHSYSRPSPFEPITHDSFEIRQHSTNFSMFRLDFCRGEMPSMTMNRLPLIIKGERAGYMMGGMAPLPSLSFRWTQLIMRILRPPLPPSPPPPSSFSPSRLNGHWGRRGES